MPVYNAPQSGYNVNSALNLTSVISGESFTLFSGSETPSVGLKSVAFARGPAPGTLGDNGISFYCHGDGTSAGQVVSIQGANQNVDAAYITLSEITLDSAGDGAYTDVGRAAFYRAVLSTFASGTMPTVTAQR